MNLHAHFKHYIILAIFTFGCSSYEPPMAHYPANKEQIKCAEIAIKKYFGVRNDAEIRSLYKIDYSNFRWSYKTVTKRYARMTLWNIKVYNDWRYVSVEGGFPHNMFFVIDIESSEVVDASVDILIDMKSNSIVRKYDGDKVAIGPMYRGRIRQPQIAY